MKDILSILKSTFAPLISLALLMLGMGYFTTFISVRLNLEHYSPTMIGIVQSAFYTGFLVGARIDPLLKRVKHIRAYTLFASIATSAILLQAALVSPYFWIVLRFIGGICLASLFVVIESWLLLISPPHRRGLTLAFYMIALYGSLSLGQFFVELFDQMGFIPFIIAGFLTSLSSVPISFTYTKVPTLAKSAMKRTWQIYRGAPFGFMGCVLSGVILSIIYSFVPNYAQAIEVPVAHVMSLTICGGFLLQWPIGHLSDLFDRRIVLLSISIATLLPCFAILFFQGNVPILFILSFILGGFCFTIYPVSMTQVTDRFQPEDITSITGTLVLVYSFGAIVGPLFAPIFIYFFGAKGIYLCIATAGALLSLFGLFAIKKHPPVPEKEQGQFIPQPPQQTPATINLDPRSEELKK